jgi:hypothetical protein
LFRVSTLAEIRGGRLRDISPEALEAALLGAFRGAAPESAGFWAARASVSCSTECCARSSG